MASIYDILEGPRPNYGVEHTPELDRVAALARQPVPTEADIDAWSAWLRLNPHDDRCPAHLPQDCPSCGGTGRIRLRPKQCAALAAARGVGGLFAPLQVGEGKTLISLALPTVLEAKRPILVVPASLKDKTHDDYAALAKAWRVRLPFVMSYAEISQPDNRLRLIELAPDLAICDEADKLAKLTSARTQRFAYAVKHLNPRPYIALLSGTLMGAELMQFWHLMVWALGLKAPVPTDRGEAELWARALDDNVPTTKRIDLGALRKLPQTPSVWMRETHGVIPSAGSNCSADLYLHWWKPTVPPRLRAVINAVEESGLRPDGEPLGDWGKPVCLCELVQGYFSIWDPMPPDWWLLPRRNWFAFLRAVREEGIPEYDSDELITRALDHSDHRPRPLPYFSEGQRRLAEWRAVKDQFEPNPVPIWLDDSVLRQAVEFAREAPTLIWTRHVPPGIRLSQYGLPYYGADTRPDQHPRVESIVVSQPAHGAGKNLQRWSRSLWLEPMANEPAWEQGLGRTHRQGQRAAEVHNWLISAIDYHHEVIDRLSLPARRASENNGYPRKLVAAKWVRD